MTASIKTSSVPYPSFFRSVVSAYAMEHFSSDVRRDIILERRLGPQIDAYYNS